MKEKRYKSPIAAISVATLIAGSAVTVQAFDCSELGTLAQYDPRCSEAISKPDSPSSPVAPAPSPADGMKPFQGRWRVSYERSLAAFKQSPEYSPEQFETMPPMARLFLEKMEARITGNEIALSMPGAQEIAISCAVTQVSETTTLANCTAKGKTVEVAFKLIDGEYMNFRLSNSDDADYLIWKRVE